jgi:uncharacterized protein YraI/beta-lactamase class A
MRRRTITLSTIILAAALGWLAAAPAGHGQDPPPDVFAEALGQANLRHGPGIEYPLVGEISAGERYRVLARHSQVPWLQLAIPAIAGAAWVYADLVTITGDLAQVPASNDFPPVETPHALVTPVRDVPPDPTATALLPTATPTAAGPVATTLGDANVRFGPGTEYPAIVEVPAGTRFRVVELHTLVPWVRVSLADAADTVVETGWIFREIVEIEGDISQVPMTNAIQFGYPTLTPTPQTVIVNGAPWRDAAAASGELAETLGKALHEYLLQEGYAPYTDQFGSVFVLDLATGDTFTLNDGVAFSGMSLTKIPILVTYFQRHDGPLTADEAFLVADTMMCSENITTNQLLEQIGDGDPYRGAQRVTALMQSLDLRGTFILRTYVIREDEPTIDVGTITTGADQSSARPDRYNQMLPRDLGWLLAGIYQCAANETGLLMERYPNDFDAHECRQMLYAMDANVINVFTEAGVPPGTPVLHKHGWIEDSHGDAAIVLGADTAYVFVAALYGEDWLEFEFSSPVMAELSRLVWNALNPSAPVDATDIGTVPDVCDPRSDPVMTALLSDSLPMIER